MLSFVLTDIYNNDITLSNALSLRVNIEQDVACDDLSVVFPFSENFAEMKRIKMFDGENLVFSGIVDEQSVITAENYAYIKITARSLCGLLVDNEAKPMCYNRPSLNVLFRQLLKPLGFKKYNAEDKLFEGTLTVYKGQSVYTVLSSFFKSCFGCMPRITPDGVLSDKPEGRDLNVKLSDKGDGIVYTRLHIRNLRHKLISQVNIKREGSYVYDTKIYDENAISRGVISQRYLNADNGGLVSVADGDEMLRKSEMESYEVSCDCIGRHLNLLGAEAEIKNQTIKNLSSLYISKITYILKSNEEKTTLYFKRK